MSEPVMKQSRGDGIAIQIAEWAGHGPTVLCVHGMTANSRCWDRIVAGLVPDYRVVALDLRGRGLSDKPPNGYGIDGHVRDIHAVLAAEKLGPVVLMGHSLGAMIALAFAAKHPSQVLKLIMLDAGGRLSQSHWDQIETAIRPSVDRLGQIFPSYEDYTAPLKNAPFLQPWTPYHETYFQYETEALAEGVRSRTLPGPIRQDLSDVRRVDTVVWQRQVTCPVLVLGATEGLLSPADRLLPADVARDIEQEMPQARIMALPDTDHFSILCGENAARDQHLRRFLSAG